MKVKTFVDKQYTVKIKLTEQEYHTLRRNIKLATSVLPSKDDIALLTDLMLGLSSAITNMGMAETVQ